MEKQTFITLQALIPTYETVTIIDQNNRPLTHTTDWETLYESLTDSQKNTTVYALETNDRGEGLQMTVSRAEFFRRCNKYQYAIAPAYELEAI